MSAQRLPELLAHRWHRPLSRPAAFALTVVEGTPVLVWAEPGAGGAELRRVALPSHAAWPPSASASVGRRLRREKAAIVELHALGTDAGLVGAWVTAEGELFAATFSDEAHAALDLGPVDLADTSANEARRGLVALAQQASGEVFAFARGATEPCRDPTEGARCTTFGSVEVTRAKAEPRPRLSVPGACAGGGVVGFHIDEEGRWAYGVCSTASGRPETTLFVAQPSPSYAQAEPQLTGCSPEGLTALGDSLWTVGHCPTAAMAARFKTSRFGRAVPASPAVSLEALAVRCVEAQLVLELADPGFRHPLSSATDGLGPLLPDELAPVAAQAVYVPEPAPGGSLVVALAAKQAGAGFAVELARHRCIDGGLVRDR